MSEQAVIEKIASLQKESLRTPERPESEDFIKNHSDFGLRESSHYFEDFTIWGLSEDGVLWIKDESPLTNVYAIAKDRIVRKINCRRLRIQKIFLYKKETYAVIRDKIVLLDSVDESTVYSEIPIASLERHEIYTSPDKVMDM